MRSGALVALLLIAACGSDRAGHGPHDDSVETPSASAPADESVPLSQPRMQFAASLAAAESGEFATSFKLLAQRDILAKVEMPLATLEGEAVLAHFQLTNPDGVEHSSKWYALSANAAAPATLHHAALDRDIPVQALSTEGKMAFFYAKIPVAGTNFTRYRLQGEFTATVRLGTEAGAPLIASSFVMEL